MAEESAESAAAKVLGFLISAALAALPSLTAGFTGVIGSALAAMLSVMGGICGPIAFIYYRRSLDVLAVGDKPKGTRERAAYDKLRESLSEGNIAARLYASRLSAFLDAVDRFFGDAGLAKRTLFPRAFGLKTPAPLWTAPAFDRCLLLALIYPIATIFVIWAVSGHVGPSEAALGLKPDLPGWSRGLMAVAVAFQCFTIWRFDRTKGWKSLVWLVVAFAVASAFAAAGAVAGAVPVAGVFAAVVAVAFASVFYVFFAVAGAGHGGILLLPVFAFAFAVVFAVIVAITFATAGASALGVAGAFAVAFVLCVVVVVAVFLFVLATDLESQEASSAFILPVLLLACFSVVFWLSPLKIWGMVGPLLLFLGLLTLINAPFGWASLGLTRALLRRGLELGGWWPFLLALADAVLAGVIVAALAVTMVIGVQAFDGLAAHRGGTPILPLDALFDGIAAHPTAPEYWWLYALLLSTVIPSLINLAIGGASLMRGVPGVPSLLLRFMPDGEAVPAFDRVWIALVLTLQIAVGAILGIAAQALLIAGVIAYVMPWLGLGLLDMARDIAAFNLPLRVGQFFAGIF
jgi:hypothetical protein